MLFIVDKNISKQTNENLREFGDVIMFETQGITYPAISNHPDIFFCKVDNKLIYSPNTPQNFIKQIRTKIECVEGKTCVDNKYPLSAKYNAVVSDNFLIHNLKITDKLIIESTRQKKIINVKQGYCRCNVLPLRENHFITSDEGIYKSLMDSGLKSLYVKPDDIILPGVKYGFFGGACGVTDDTVVILGSLKHFSDGLIVRDYLINLKYNIVELYDGPLFDGGSILII